MGETSEIKTYLSGQELEEFRQMLLEKRKELTDDVAGLSDALESEKDPDDIGGGLSKFPTHPADVGTDLYEQELSAKEIVRQRERLAEIDHALSRIAKGTYGMCEATGKPIDRKRLQARPWARYSIDYAREMEQRGIHVT